MVYYPTKLQVQSSLAQKVLTLSKRYESTEVYRRTWLHVPSGTHWLNNGILVKVRVPHP